MGYAWRILKDGVCDGCALGSSGLRDWTMKGMHLCWIRLNLLRLNTLPPFDPQVVGDVRQLKELSEKELRNLGRIPTPLLRRRGEPGFRKIPWREALKLIAEGVRNTTPDRIAFYLTSRGTVNETYYVAQKVARLLGTNNIDNSARICHAPSTTALKQALGYAATTCSYRDIIGTGLLVFFGSNVANNQPVMMKYIHLAKKAGTKIVVVNPFREPGMERYWVPSAIDSALLGTNVTDHYFQVRVGGDIAFINGVLKHLIAEGWIDREFIRLHTKGWNELVEELERQPFDLLEELSGVAREDMRRFAELYADAPSAIFVWSMGITMHRFGVQAVRAIINLALARGMVGRPRTGLMAIRGHSGVQGGAEMGAVPNLLPGGVPLDSEGRARIERLWGFKIPEARGRYIAEVVDAAWRGELDMLYCVGSNLFAVLPDSEYVKEALARIPLRVHHDLVLNHQMLIEPLDAVLILPATTRYEMAGGNTETTTERRVIFNPEILGPRIPEARDEWRVLAELAGLVKPELADRVAYTSTAQIREEIAQIIPYYDGIQRLSKKGDQFQWGGERLCEGGRFATPDGKAHFLAVRPPQLEVPEGWFQLIPRRAKQFNTIIFAERDVLTDAARDEVIMNPSDMVKLGVGDGELVMVKSQTGVMEAHVRGGNTYPGTVVMCWPECNRLIRRGVVDPACGIPAYRDEVVQVLPVRRGSAEG